jgi:hypothetical protein
MLFVIDLLRKVWYGRGMKIGSSLSSNRALQEVSDLFDELEGLLKNNDVGSALAEEGVNVALALTAVAGVRSYIEGKKITAIQDLSTVVEEIAFREGVDELGEKSSFFWAINHCLVASCCCL